MGVDARRAIARHPTGAGDLTTLLDGAALIGLRRHTGFYVGMTLERSLSTASPSNPLSKITNLLLLLSSRNYRKSSSACGNSPGWRFATIYSSPLIFRQRRAMEHLPCDIVRQRMFLVERRLQNTAR